MNRGAIEAAYPLSRSERVRDDVLRRLRSFGPLTWTPMFKGFGIFFGRDLFCMISNQGEAGLRLSGPAADSFIDEGSRKMGRLDFWTIPKEILHDQYELESWVSMTLELVQLSKPRASA